MLRRGRPISSQSFARRKRQCAGRAFTLIEAIMALVVLSIAMVPLMMALQRLSQDQVTPVMSSRARWLAVEKIEEIIADRHSALRGYEYLLDANYPAELAVESDTDFAREVSIVETDVDLRTPGTGYKVITVAVSWDDPVHGRQSLDLQTVVADSS